MDGALPTMVVVGAMKCGTTALHRYLDAHPDFAMAAAKEVNFFVGPDTDLGDPATAWRRGHWHRGVQWYGSLFDPQAPVRGETSPGRTPGCSTWCAPRWSERHRSTGITRARVRNVARWRGTGRPGQPFRHAQPLRRAARAVPAALSARTAAGGRRGAAAEGRRQTLRAVFEHVGADPRWWSSDLDHRWHVGDRQTRVPARLHEQLHGWVAEDVHRLRELM